MYEICSNWKQINNGLTLDNLYLFYISFCVLCSSLRYSYHTYPPQPVKGKKTIDKPWNQIHFCKNFAHTKNKSVSWFGHIWVQWVSESCLTPIEQFFFLAISWQEQATLQWDEVRCALDQHLSWVFIMFVHWNNSSQVDISLHLGTLSSFRTK